MDKLLNFNIVIGCIIIFLIALLSGFIKDVIKSKSIANYFMMFIVFPCAIYLCVKLYCFLFAGLAITLCEKEISIFSVLISNIPNIWLSFFLLSLIRGDKQ